MAKSKTKSTNKKKKRAGGGSAWSAASEQQPQNAMDHNGIPELFGFGQLGDNDIIIETDTPDAITKLDSSIEIDTETGDVIIDTDPQPELYPKSIKFTDNLADYLPSGVQARIVEMLLEAVDQDERDRAEWLEQRAMGLDLLGMKIERPGNSAGGASAPLDGMSRVRDPLLLEAVLRAQANAYSELCPSEGPVKIVNYGDEDAATDEMCEELEKDFNFFFTQTAKEYYDDTRSMLGMTCFASGMFKKVYWHPLLQRPISESVDGADLILPSTAVSLKTTSRVTHAIDMDQTIMKRMQLMGAYRDVVLGAPTPITNVLDSKIASITGLNLRQQRMEDQQYTVYECYVNLDVEGYEHTKANKPTGLPLPYKVSIDKDSRTLLELRRNWDEDDDGYEIGNVEANIPFVAFPFVTAGFAGIYGIGLLHILGNISMALTAMLREGIDAGMFANFPGGLIIKPATRQTTNEIRVAPGTLAPVDIGGGGDIRAAIMSLPYKDVTQGLLELMQMMREVGMRVGGTAETPVGEGTMNAPVGTTLALIEQATKVEGAVHKSFHAAQSEEFAKFKKLFQEDPASVYKTNKRPALGSQQQIEMDARVAKLKAALDHIDIVPASDPNVPSHMHRLAKAQTLKQLTMGNPAYNQTEIDTRVAAMLHIDDFSSLINPAQPQQMDPMAQAQMQKNALAAQKLESDNVRAAIQYQNDQEDRASKETIEALRIANTAGVHPQADSQMDEQLMQMLPLIHPIPPQQGHGQPPQPSLPIGPGGMPGSPPGSPPKSVIPRPMTPGPGPIPGPLGASPAPGPRPIPPMFGVPRADGGPVLSPEAERAATMAAHIAKFLRDRATVGGMQ